MDLSLGMDILSGLFWLPIILNHSQKNSICIVNWHNLERGASWVCGCGCVGQNLDKEGKFDLMTGNKDKKRPLGA